MKIDAPYYYTNGQLYLTDIVDMPEVFNYITMGGYQKKGRLAQFTFSQQRTQGVGRGKGDLALANPLQDGISPSSVRKKAEILIRQVQGQIQLAVFHAIPAQRSRRSIRDHVFSLNDGRSALEQLLLQAGAAFPGIQQRISSAHFRRPETLHIRLAIGQSRRYPWGRRLRPRTALRRNGLVDRGILRPRRGKSSPQSFARVSAALRIGLRHGQHAA